MDGTRVSHDQLAGVLPIDCKGSFLHYMHRYAAYMRFRCVVGELLRRHAT